MAPHVHVATSHKVLALPPSLDSVWLQMEPRMAWGGGGAVHGSGE